MTDFSFLSGAVRAQESKLLTVNRLDRMIGAATPEDAFRVMVELSYAHYVDESTQSEDFSKIIERGLLETKHLIRQGAANDECLQFLWRRFDVNNFKRAFKAKLLEGASELGGFTESQGYSLLGDFGSEALQEIVFEGKMNEAVPESFAKVINQITTIYEAHNSFRDVEFAFDQAHLDSLSEISNRSKNTFCQDLFNFIVDSANFRALARSVLLLKEPVPTQAWSKHGTLYLSDAQVIEDYAALEKFAARKDFGVVFVDIEETDTSAQKLVKIERGVDKLFARFMKENVQGEVASIQIPMHYFEQRLQNARLLKFVMFSKFHGLEPEEIYKALKHF
jgi:vacuolar-type H+-ATPase subunit C/Vma6